MEPNLNDIIRRPVYKGVYACELEIEFDGSVAYADDFKIRLPMWSQVKDGSLRNGFELVMKGPVSYKKLPEVLLQPAQGLSNISIGFDDITLLDAIKWSNRCSTHIHMNVQQFTPRQLLLFSTIWYVFESVIVDKFAAERAGNLFCLRAVDAPIFVEHIIENFSPRNLRFLDMNRRYMGLNWASLSKFCSLEFRYLRGSVDPEYILDFVSYLEGLRTWILKSDKDPKDMLSLISQQGLAEIYEMCFGKSSEGINFTSQIVWESLRFAQDLCYGVDLTLFNNVINNDDDRMEEPLFFAEDHLQDEGDL